jgi:hypothetical protein
LFLYYCLDPNSKLGEYMPPIPPISEIAAAAQPAVTAVKRPFLGGTADSFYSTSTGSNKAGFFQKISQFFQNLLSRLQEFFFGKTNAEAASISCAATETVSEVTKRHRLNKNGSTVLESLDKRGRMFQRETLRSDGGVLTRERIDKKGNVYQRDSLHPNGDIAQQEFLNAKGQTISCNVWESGRITAREFMNRKGAIDQRDILSAEGKVTSREFLDADEALVERHVLNKKGEVTEKEFFDKEGKLIPSDPKAHE